ncbi:MAG TPA: aminopeptidase P family N-terminal domain-containing protein [Candidatus Megaira endosymbiont of Hartmannula sinica]|nr:aminopeptidase P family N-terminal domain-containing protein [Candidatus Megaera endosymbiont of Hartmannula sinica]
MGIYQQQNNNSEKITQQNSIYSSRISTIRNIIQKENIDIYVVNSYDEYQNTDLRIDENKLYFLLGFHTSNGLLFISADKLLYFTDGRYIAPAREMLGSYVDIFDIAKLSTFNIQ